MMRAGAGSSLRQKVTGKYRLAVGPCLRAGWAWMTAGMLAMVSCNPFAPALDPDAAKPTALGDRRTVQGFFEYFRNAYQLRDSTLYGHLLTRDFTFTYTNFADNTLQTWTRDVDVLTTYRLFRGIRSATLQWNQYIDADTARSDTVAVVERAFNLVINQDDENVYRGVGTARLELRRGNRAEPWRMRSWFDKSDF